MGHGRREGHTPSSVAEDRDTLSSRFSREAPPKLSTEADVLKLTKRQREVLSLLTRGSSNKEIARVLGIAEATTKIHIAALLRALGVRNRTETAYKARNFVALTEPSDAPLIADNEDRSHLLPSLRASANRRCLASKDVMRGHSPLHFRQTRAQQPNQLLHIGLRHHHKRPRSTNDVVPEITFQFVGRVGGTILRKERLVENHNAVESDAFGNRFVACLCDLTSNIIVITVTGDVELARAPRMRLGLPANPRILHHDGPLLSAPRPYGLGPELSYKRKRYCCLKSTRVRQVYNTVPQSRLAPRASVAEGQACQSPSARGPYAICRGDGHIGAGRECGFGPAQREECTVEGQHRARSAVSGPRHGPPHFCVLSGSQGWPVVKPPFRPRDQGIGVRSATPEPKTWNVLLPGILDLFGRDRHVDQADLLTLLNGRCAAKG